MRAFESRGARQMLRGIMLEDFGGARDSFARAEATSALALARGQPQRARDAWQRMLANPFYARPTPTRLEAERRLALLWSATPSSAPAASMLRAVRIPPDRR